MKKIIALYAKADSGKTRTLLILIDKIRKIEDKELFYEKYGDEEFSDVTIVVVIGGVIIGITSRGDRATDLNAVFPMFFQKGCVIIVCPTRTKQSTVEVVEIFRKANDYEIVWWDKSRTDDEDEVLEDKLNSEDAEKIFGEINRLIASSAR